MTDNFIRLPPDSTGKRSTTVVSVSLDYTGHTPQVMAVGDTITGATSGAYGSIVKISPDGGDPTIGVVEIRLSVDSPSNSFSDTENLQVLGGTVAQASGIGEEYHTQKVAVAGGNSPFNQAFVDNQGALYVRNSEGAPQYDAFGLTRAAAPTLMAEYVFYYGNMDAFQEFTNGTATITHLNNESAMALDVGTGSGDEAQMTTNLYHRYQPAMGQYVNMTVVCGDTGKTNLTRRWGYYDDNDGLYFELDGTGTLCVGIRTSTSGSPVDTIITQANWNVDRVDGSLSATNLSRFNLDPSKLNLYWIDFAWLGAGKVRFGVFDDDGGRIICHVFKNPNTDSVPYLKTPVLPIRTEIVNTGVTGSPSRLKMVCAGVMTDGRLIPDRKRKSVKRSFVGGNVSGITTEVPLASFRSTLTLGGLPNRKITLPEIFSFYVQDQPILVRVRKNPSLTGASFALHEDSAVDVDTTASAVSGGDVLLSYMLPVGAQNFDAPPNFGIQGESMKLSADGTHGDIYSVTAEALTGTTQVRPGFTWIDIG